MSTTAIINFIIQLLAGAGGGHGLAKALKQFDLGPLGNTIAGALGGLGGGAWLGPLIAGMSGDAGAGAMQGLDVGMVAGDVVGGGIGGAVLTLVAGLVRKAVSGGKAA